MIILKNDIYSLIFLFIKFNHNLNLDEEYILINDPNVLLVNGIMNIQLYDQYIQDFLILIKNINKCINVYKLSYSELQNILFLFLKKNIKLRVINSTDELHMMNVEIIDFYSYFNSKHKIHSVCNSIYQSNELIILNNNSETLWFSQKTHFNIIVKELTLMALNDTKYLYLDMVEKQDILINIQNIILFISFVLITIILLIKIMNKSS